MRSLPRFPLIAKAFVWLLLHLAILMLGFVLFVIWQLGLGLDSLMSGSAGDRLKSFGDQVVESIIPLDRSEWSAEVMRQAEERGLQAVLVSSQQEMSFSGDLPENVRVKVGAILPPHQPPTPRAGPPPSRPHMRDPLGPPPRMRMPGGPPADTGPDDLPMPRPNRAAGEMNPAASSFVPESRPVFLMRGDGGNGYWAGVAVHFPSGSGLPRLPGFLLIRSNSIDGGGMFFDFKPWLWGGLAVLLASLVVWAPFVWSISSYLKRLTAATDNIAAGRFQVSIPVRGHDELGTLGRTIQSMARRLDHLLTGQKRFLGDAAHELCAPLARIRTGLGILETKLQGADAASLESIDADVAELADLVNEILAFSRAGKREPASERVALHAIALEAINREAVDCEVVLRVPEGIELVTDRRLLSRAIGNLIRNAAFHAGSDVTVTIDAESKGGVVTLTVGDNGRGVPSHELPHLFEPFYRIDKSRSRDSGGSGLGLAIVRTAVEACRGEVHAFLPAKGGFGVTIQLPEANAQKPGF